MNEHVPYYGFYSDAGNTFAHDLVQLVRVDGPIEHVGEAKAETESIQRLAAEHGYTEATDTDCREHIFAALIAPPAPAPAVNSAYTGVWTRDLGDRVEVIANGFCVATFTTRVLTGLTGDTPTFVETLSGDTAREFAHHVAATLEAGAR